LLLALGVAALAGDSPCEDDPRITLELDPHELAPALARADALLAAGKADEALAALERLERAPGAHDGFFARQDPAGPVDWRGRILVSLDRELRARFLALPESVRAAYDESHDTAASRLEEQGRAGDLARFAELVERFPASSRAPRAALRLAEGELERGRGDAAVLRFETLLAESSARLDAGEVARVRCELPAALTLAGRDAAAERALAGVASGSVATARSLVARALGAREASLDGGPGEVAVAWAHDDADAFGGRMAGSRRPCKEPAVDAGEVYVHDGRQARALDLATGKLLWRTTLQAGERAGDENDAPCPVALGRASVVCFLPDGLVALDRARGAIRFELAADALGRIVSAPEQARLSLHGALTDDALVVAVLATSPEESDLVAIGLDPLTGSVRWKTRLGSEGEVGGRAAPVVASGPDAVYVLSCSGVVAALEPSTGSVLWLRRYVSELERPSRAVAPPRLARLNRRGEPPKQLDPDARRGFVGYVHGRVLVAPPDREEVMAFDARTGEAVWATPDGGARVVGPWRTGLIEADGFGHVSLAGERVVSLHRAELEAKLPTYTTPVGRPALAGDLLYLPLETGIFGVNLETGETSLVAGWSATTCGFANLACSRGTVIAAGVSRTVALASPEASVAAALNQTDAAAACRALADPSFRVREAAQARLIALGPEASRELEAACQAADPEESARARRVQATLLWTTRHTRWRREPGVVIDPRQADIFERLMLPDGKERLEAIVQLVSRNAAGTFSPILADLLDDPDARVARSAALTLLSHGRREGISVIASMLDATSSKTRLRALEALFGSGSAEDLPIFAKGLADDDESVRRLAYTCALVRGGAGAAPLLLAALGGADYADQAHVLGEISARAIPAGLAGPILAKLADGETPPIRDQAVRLLGRFDDPTALAALARALAADSLELRRTAWRSARELVRREIDPRLPASTIERGLANRALEPSSAIDVAAGAIARGTRISAAALAAAAADAPEKVRDRALAALEADVALAPLARADVAAIASLAGTSPAVARQCYLVLEHARGAGRAQLFVAGFTDERLRARAAESAGHAFDAELGAELLELEVLGATPVQRASAGELLVLLAQGAPGRRPALARACLAGLGHASGGVRASALARLKAAAPGIASALGAYDPSGPGAERAVAVRRAALALFAGEHGNKGPEAFTIELGSASPETRRAAAAALGELGSPGLRCLVTEALENALGKSAAGDADEAARRAKIAALASLSGREP
jgi:outer membrane protein assembly factor BamB/HEAT repeat protein